MVNQEIKDLMNRAVEKLTEKKYFQSVGMTLYKDQFTGERLTKWGNYPTNLNPVPTIENLVNFTKI